MKRLAPSGMGVALFATLLLSAPSSAAVIPFVSNPTTNSIDFTNAVIGLGGSLNTNVNFDTHPLGALQPNFYLASDGVTLAQTGSFNTVVFGAGPGQSNTFTPPLSGGEGPHPASNFVFASAVNSTFTISFTNPVLGAGFYLIDLFNPGSQSTRNTPIIEAYTGPNGTGALLGSFSAALFNFQPNNLYFMGIVSTDGDIGSIRLVNPGAASDQIGLDNVVFAPAQVEAVPEPATLAVFGVLAAGAFGARRRMKARA